MDNRLTLFWLFPWRLLRWFMLSSLRYFPQKTLHTTKTYQQTAGYYYKDLTMGKTHQSIWADFPQLVNIGCFFLFPFWYWALHHKNTQKRFLSKRLKQPFTVKTEVTLVHLSWFSIYNQRRREEIEKRGRKFY